MAIKLSTRKLLTTALFLAASIGVLPQSPPVVHGGGGAQTKKAVNVATFDSGFGGFFTAKEIEKQMRMLSGEGYGPFVIAHYGDTTNIPYGEKDPEEIAKFASEGILTAFHDGAKDVYIACNTASTQFEKIKAIIRAENPSYPNHVYSIVDISVSEVMKTVSERLKKQDLVAIAVLATPATVKTENYPKFVARALSVEFKPGEFIKSTKPRWLKSKGGNIDNIASMTELALGPKKKVVIYQMAPANWVEMIENGASDAEKREAVKNDLQLLADSMRPGQTIDVVGEFCTHYPVVDAMIQEEMNQRGMVSKNAPFIVQGPLMAALFKRQFLQKKPGRSAQPVEPPGTPPIYLSGANIEATRSLVKKIFPNDTEPAIQTKEFVKLN